MISANDVRRDGMLLVTVERMSLGDLDWNELAWSTIQRMVDLSEPSPGRDDVIEGAFREIMRDPGVAGAEFYCPQTFVHSALPTRDFLAAARAAQCRWRNTLKQTLCWTSSRWKKEIRAVSPIICQL